ncbi:hypothetical protein Tco_0082532, partial [Tanacetum coccineum]
NKLDESQSYLTAAEHRECYNGLIKSYDLDKNLFPTYDKVYSLKRSRKDKDKDEDLFAGSDRGLKKRKTSKDAEPKKGLKAKESTSSSSKGIKSQSKSSRKTVHAEEPKFEVADYDMPQDQDFKAFPGVKASCLYLLWFSIYALSKMTKIRKLTFTSRIGKMKSVTTSN